MTTNPVVDLGRVDLQPVERTALHETLVRASPIINACLQATRSEPPQMLTHSPAENEAFSYAMTALPMLGLRPDEQRSQEFMARFSAQFFARLPPAERERVSQLPTNLHWTLMREVYWQSTLPAFEAWRLWSLIDDICNGGAGRLRHGIARLLIDEPTDERCDALADATMKLVRELQRALAITGEPPISDEDANERVATLNEGFIEQLRKLGKAGVDAADAVQARIAQGPKLDESEDVHLWRWWHHSEERLPRFLLMLSKALWLDKVKEQQQIAERRRSAMVRAVCTEQLVPLMTRQTQFPEFDDGTIRDDRGRVLATVSLTTDTTIEAVRRGAHALGTVPGNRLIRALIHRSHDAWNRGEHDPRRVAFDGGWAGLLKAIDVPEKANHTLVREIAIAGACIVWSTPNVKAGGLWTWSERRGSKAKPGEVAFVLGDALTPGYGEQLSRLAGSTSLQARVARRLVPELRHEPPMGSARPVDHGRIWTLHRLMLIELVDKAEDLYDDGAVEITGARWRQLAEHAGVAKSIVDRTLDAWVAGESESAPALLKRVDCDAWTLAQPHAPELEFIARGGERRAKGRTAKRRRRRRGAD